MTYTLAACAHPVDPRDGTEDESLAYITETIFVPYCATAECHSTFKQASIPGGIPIVLDTVEGAQTTLQSQTMIACAGSNGGTIDPCDTDADPTGNAVNSTELISILTTGYGELRMPYDEPLANKDIQFLAQWIVDGADGYVPNVMTDSETGSN
ncbi:MAG TPA: hypothetical protein VH143_26735 [Kofleriaceae bacterium]|jgi:hypothetical protein|nr:hypothetical protein [Kofleriaceae bacterium]